MHPHDAQSAPHRHSPHAATVSRRAALALGAAGLATAAVSPAALARRVQPANADAPGAPAPQPAPQPPGFYRFTLGGAECVSFSDGTFDLPVALIRPTPNTPDDILRRMAGGDTWQGTCNILHFRAGGESVLVDAGCGAAFGPTVGRLEANMQAAGVDPHSITAVVVTHAHLDHVGGLLMQPPSEQNTDPARRFPNARVIITQTEYDFWTSPNPDLSGLDIPAEQKAGFVAGARSHLTRFGRSLEFVQPGQKLFGGAVEVLDAAGHTPGHAALLIDLGDNEPLLHIADLAHHHLFMFRRPEWHIAFDADPAGAVASRRRIFDRARADNLRVYAYHTPWTGLGRIEPEGAGRGASYRWAPEPWLWR